MWYSFSVMETNYSTPLINVCSEKPIQQKRLPISVKNVVLFSVMKTDPTSVNNVVLFPVTEKDYSTHLITVYIEDSIKKPSSQFSEQSDTFPAMET